jgi:hypothetical protein
MARKTSLWSELQREMDRRQRAAVARERSQQQMVRQVVQERERAVRQAARAEAAERIRQQDLAHEAGAAAPKALREQLEARLAELRALLRSALAKPPEMSFVSLKRSPTATSFDPGGLAEPLPALAWDAFAPPAPGLLSKLVGGKARHARALEVDRSDLERALADHERAENDRLRQLNDALSVAGGACVLISRRLCRSSTDGATATASSMSATSLTATPRGVYGSGDLPLAEPGPAGGSSDLIEGITLPGLDG